METLGLVLFVIGVVVAFFGAVAACAVVKVGSPRKKRIASQPESETLWKSM
jgi:hypothetical protein